MELNNQIVPYDKQDENHRFVQTYDDQEFIDAVRELEIAAISDVADRAGCSKELARIRLNDLAERGRLKKRVVGQQHIFLMEF